jgi:hypothetical protein
MPKAGQRGHKAFAASPEGRTGAAAGFFNAAVAAREALRACDAAGAGCNLIDVDGQPVPLALQYAQASRADRSSAGAALPLRTLSVNAGVQVALEGYREKPVNKAFAISLKGPWGRAWEAATPDEAVTEALATCNRSADTAGAPCFILMANGTALDPATLVATPGLAVESAKSQ